MLQVSPHSLTASSRSARTGVKFPVHKLLHATWLALALASCSSTVPTDNSQTANSIVQVSSSQNTSSPQNRSVVPQTKNETTQPIRSIDFRNFTYPWYPSDTRPPYKNRTITLKDGEFQIDATLARKIENLWITFGNASYSDLTGDGSDEAIVTIGGIETFNSGTGCIFIYQMNGSVLKLLWKHETGDRAAGGLRSIRVTDGDLVVEQYDMDLKKETGLCCPKRYVRTSYRWTGKEFRAISREILPNEFENAKFLGYPSNS